MFGFEFGIALFIAAIAVAALLLLIFLIVVSIRAFFKESFAANSARFEAARVRAVAIENSERIRRQENAANGILIASGSARIPVPRRVYSWPIRFIILSIEKFKSRSHLKPVSANPYYQVGIIPSIIAEPIDVYRATTIESEDSYGIRHYYQRAWPVGPESESESESEPFSSGSLTSPIPN